MADPREKLRTRAPKAPLNELQLELLKLYETEMTREELEELKRVLSKHFARKATAAADRRWAERGLTDSQMDAWLHE